MCLKPSALAIKSLQRHDLTLGDVYKIYNMAFISTAEIRSPFSQDLIDNFTKRRDMLFEHDVFLAALKFEITDIEKLTATKHLKFLHLKLKSIQFDRNELLEENDADAESVLCSSGLEDVAHDTEELMELKYEKSFARKERNSVLQFSDTPKMTTDLDIILNSFKPQRSKVNVNVHQYWEQKKIMHYACGII